MNNINKNVDYLVMGNSHSLAIQTDIITNSINIASYGEDIHNTYYKLKHVVNERSIKPSAIILSCDLGMLKNLDIDHQAYQFYWNRYENHLELFHFSEKPTEYIINRIADYLFPYKDGEIEVFDYLFADNNSKEQAILRNHHDIKRRSASDIRVVNSECQDQEISELGQYYFRNFIELCRLHDIELVLVRFPVTPHYYFQHSTCFDPEMYYDELKVKFIRDSDQIQLLDFHDFYDESAFADPDHLNGGKVRDDLTKLIIYKLENIK